VAKEVQHVAGKKKMTLTSKLKIILVGKCAIRETWISERKTNTEHGKRHMTRRNITNPSQATEKLLTN